jgi:Fe2+ or Zn2+ uptake regulation protein
MVTNQVEGESQPPSTHEDNLDRYVQVLRDHRIKATNQRLSILQYLDSVDDHLDVDTIYNALKGNNPSLSKTTVYNTLDLFRSKGIVQALTISGTEHRYELSRGMHHHLFCHHCGRIYNIDVSCPYLDEMLHDEHKIEEVHGYFRGICKNCLGEAGVLDNKEEK